jgi:arylsulfatase A-like enzyme
MAIHPRRFLAVVAPMIVLVGAGCSRTEPEVVPPNILLISIDALRADHLGAWGAERETSPFLDGLAAQGIRFSHAFVNTHGTPPSHTTMFSSLYQETHRVGVAPDPETPPPLSVPDGVEMVQEILARDGWTTVGVTGGGYAGADFGFGRGFEVFNDRARDVDRGRQVLVDSLRGVLPSGRPIFAFFHTYEVHSPYRSPPEYDGLFGAEECRVATTSEALLELVGTAGKVLDESDFDCIATHYDRGIRYTDDTLRRLADDLGAMGFLDNALVIITADHGEEFGDHGGLLHGGTLFEELLHVPLIVWRSGMAEGRVDHSLASTIDLAPTILAAAGLEPPPIMEGRDLLGANPTHLDHQRVFSQYGTTLYGVRTHDHKLIVRGGWGNPTLFDLENDPGERRNVAADHPELAAELLAELNEWREARPRLEDLTSETVELSPEQIEQLEALGYTQ